MIHLLIFSRIHIKGYSAAFNKDGLIIIKPYIMESQIFEVQKQNPWQERTDTLPSATTILLADLRPTEASGRPLQKALMNCCINIMDIGQSNNEFVTTD